ncbi:hypothetical protein [Thermomonas mangrovi]|uniref:hypothetical protein n=1 Tax=Thermomonas mangrovi TaxID=2993316 RepID=UPI002307A675|nr:hypothetical protein [Thermomonas mangrovi]
MKIIAIWRFLVLALAATLALALAFYWWEQHFFQVISPAVSDFLLKWWWLGVIASLAIISTAGTILILFNPRPHLIYRLLASIASYFFPPVLIAFWLVFVERFRPNNSSKPTPLRGVGKAS